MHAPAAVMHMHRDKSKSPLVLLLLEPAYIIIMANAIYIEANKKGVFL